MKCIYRSKELETIRSVMKDLIFAMVQNRQQGFEVILWREFQKSPAI